MNSSSMTSVLERPVAPLQSGGATRYERAGLALSILGEIQAVLTGRQGGKLRDHTGPIHDRPQ